MKQILEVDGYIQAETDYKFEKRKTKCSFKGSNNIKENQKKIRMKIKF